MILLQFKGDEFKGDEFKGDGAAMGMGRKKDETCTISIQCHHLVIERAIHEVNVEFFGRLVAGHPSGFVV